MVEKKQRSQSIARVVEDLFRKCFHSSSTGSEGDKVKSIHLCLKWQINKQKDGGSL